MKNLHILLLGFLLLLGITATAQFRKALPNNRLNGQIRDARLNVGLVGGTNFTTWFHFNNEESAQWYLVKYAPHFDTSNYLSNFGYFGGVALEYMLGKNTSIGFNAVYAQNNLNMAYVNDIFPNGYQQYVHKEYNLKAKYQSVEAYAPLTYYINLSANKNIKPYFYIAPRVSYIFKGDMVYNSLTTDSVLVAPGPPQQWRLDTLSFSTDSVPFNGSNFRRLNVGATLGFGSLFRINTTNYYMLVKFDVSANMNAISTYHKGEVVNNEFNHKRYTATAQASLTFMLPVKKRLKDACVKWGRYN